MRRTLPLAALAVVVLACIAQRWHWYAPETAYRGYSPIGWTYVHEHPADFAKNLPNGTEGYERSAVMWVYLLAYRHLGIEPDALVYAVIALEIIGLAWCYVRLSQNLLDDAPLSLAVAIAMLAIASSLRNVSLSRFGTPFFEGQFYTFAEIARNMALIACLRGRWGKSAAWLSVATVSHVILGAIGAMCVAAVAAMRWRPGERLRIARAALGFMVVSAAWMLGFHQPGALFSDPVPDEVWYAWTRLFNFHWYPMLNGVFLETHDRYLVPFITLLAAGALTWLHPATRPRRWRGEIGAVMAVLGVMTLLAVVASEQRWSTTLIKLALHRGADMMLSIAVIYAVAGWWHAMTSLPLWRALPATCLLFAPTWGPGAPSAQLALHGWLNRARSDAWRRWSGRWVAAVPVLVSLGYVLSGHGAAWTSSGYTGVKPLLKEPQWGVPLAIALLLLWVARRRVDQRACVLVVTLALGCLAWVKHDIPGSGAAADGADYLDAQRWAREHTPATALFFVDPTIYYGWSDYSRRSSFGNVRDWAHNWAYNSRRDWWQRGVERLALLGLSVDDYLGIKQGAARLGRDAQARFYQADDEWRRMLARDWGVDYFVMRRTPANHSELPVVYQNKKFMVLAVGAP
ncbi:MAG: hypothetical protein IPM80_23075 [Proteobacteria bacterium]|nr:hypothetical protein [Pseudomonadota bacterium]